MPRSMGNGWHPHDDMTVFRLTNIEGLLEQIRDLLLVGTSSAPKEVFAIVDAAKEALKKIEEAKK